MNITEAAEFSGNLSAQKRSEILRDFRGGKIKMYVLESIAQDDEMVS
jgi:hypothetical protein